MNIFKGIKNEFTWVASMFEMSNKSRKNLFEFLFLCVRSNKSDGFTLYNTLKCALRMTTFEMKVLEGICCLKVGGDV